MAPADVFVQGQPWKNLAAASRTGVAGAKPCALQNLPGLCGAGLCEQAGGEEERSFRARRGLLREMKKRVRRPQA